VYVIAITERIPAKVKLDISRFSDRGSKMTPAIGKLTISLNSKESMKSES